MTFNLYFIFQAKDNGSVVENYAIDNATRIYRQIESISN